MKDIKNYKPLVAVPIILLAFSIFILYNQYSQTGEWFIRSFELKGGTLITLNLEAPIDAKELRTILSSKFDDVSVRELRGFAGYGVLIGVGADINSDDVMQEIQNFGIDTSQSSIATIGPALGSTFWSQAQTGIIVAFVFMGLIVFFVFRKLMPSLYVMFSAVSDILVTLAFMQIFGIELSLAAFAALLMLIGYSVDTDILLTTRLLKGSDTLNKRIKNALKTGLTMTFTTVGALAALLLSAVSPVLSQIAAVLLMGLLIDIINTWLMNATLLRWHIEKKEANG